MFWDEKIDLLKKKYKPEDFNVPFSIASSILKKIEDKFIIKVNTNQHFNYWSENIKSKTLIKDIPFNHLFLELEKLDSDKNYWTVIILGYNPSSKHYIYDCKVNPLIALLSFSSSDFYIIEKKYEWLLYFNRTKNDDKISIYQSGNTATIYQLDFT